MRLYVMGLGTTGQERRLEPGTAQAVIVNGVLQARLGKKAAIPR